jgi:DNA-binding response OmpR family regulator
LGHHGGVASQRILLVEDEPALAEAVAARLRAELFDVAVAADGLAAVASFQAYRPELVVLDLMLPGIEGLEVCRRIQAERPVPVLMLTARDGETDELVGLAVGADDYLTKPFSMRVLVARIRALLRRAERGSPDVLRAGPLEIDPAARRVRRDGAEVHLTPTEFDLLVHLAGDPGTVFSRARLLESVWDWSDASRTRAVDSHVKALRRKLGPGLIRTVHGVGYALETS